MDGLTQNGVLVLGREDSRFRAVTHYWITDEDVERVVSVMEELLVPYGRT